MQYDLKPLLVSKTAISSTEATYLQLVSLYFKVFGTAPQLPDSCLKVTCSLRPLLPFRPAPSKCMHIRLFVHTISLLGVIHGATTCHVKRCEWNLSYVGSLRQFLPAIPYPIS